MEKIENMFKFLILSDLDGTLLNDKGELDPLTIKVIKKITKMGHIFCIVTGRPPRASIEIYKKLGLNHLMVNYNGSLITNPKSKKFLPINLGFSFSIAKRIFTNKLVSQWIESYVVENNHGTFISNIPKDENAKKVLFENFHIRDEKHVTLIEPDLSNICHDDVHTILLQLTSERHLDDLMYQIRWFADTLVTRTWRNSTLGIILEINSIFSTKGRSLKYLSSYYGISLSNCISFGDGDNDTDMLQNARFGFAMKNATITAKLYSHYITKYDNNQCGVAKELIDFFKMKQAFDKQTYSALKNDEKQMIKNNKIKE